MKSIIFLATPTSATGSMLRILTTLSEGKYTMNLYTDSFANKADLKTAVPPEENNIILFNIPPYFNRSLDLGRYRYILNLRDPRDLLCNQYHWRFVHPDPSRSEEELARHREEIRKEGIDSVSLRQDNNILYDSFYHVVKNVPADQRLFATYAMICLEFDKYLKNLCEFLDVVPTSEQLRKIELERVDNLKNNPQWIGQQWAGSDTLPGRFLRELKPETITALNEKYKKILDFLAQNDQEAVRYTYNIGR